MTIIVSRTAALAGAALTTIMLLAGCGGTGAPGAGEFGAVVGKSPFEVARNARDATVRAGSSRIEADFRFEITGAPGMDGGFDGRMTGAYDFSRQIGEFETSSAGGGLPNATSRTVVARNVVYEQFPGQDKWAKSDFSKLVNTPVGQQDPSQQLDLLRGVSDDVREVGTEQVRGEKVRHYAVTIDPKRLAAETSVVVPGSIVESAMKAVEPIPTDVFVDEQGRVRRLALTMVVVAAKVDLSSFGDLAKSPELQARLANQRSTMRMTIDYFDFGTSVSTREPDPSKVVSGPLPMSIPR